MLRAVFSSARPCRQFPSRSLVPCLLRSRLTLRKGQKAREVESGPDCPNCSCRNRNYSGYLVPTNADIPELDVLFVGGFDEELGELTAVSVAPAIANAVYHATGKRIRDLPVSSGLQCHRCCLPAPTRSSNRPGSDAASCRELRLNERVPEAQGSSLPIATLEAQRPRHAVGPESKVTTMDIGDWLRSLGLERYEAAFRDNEINEDVLPKVTAEDHKDMGLVWSGTRRVLLEAIAALQASLSAPPPAPLWRSALRNLLPPCKLWSINHDWGE